jgi:hypothetical protein
MTGQHLSDEQFTDLLARECPMDALQHMNTCPQCQREFEQVQASIEDFGAVGLQWAEDRPAPRISTSSALIRRWNPLSARTVAAGLLAAALFATYQEKRMQAPNMETILPAQSEGQVADDNRLMLAIDKEIRWQADSPVADEDPAGGRLHPRGSQKLAN